MLNEKALQEQATSFFDWVDTDIGLRTLIAIVRTGVAFALGFYFIPILSHSEHPVKNVFILISLASFAIYTVVFGMDVLRASQVMQTPKIKVAQPVAEIGFYLLFYLLSGNSWSDLFFLCFLPLFLAFRYFSMRMALVILALTSFSFSSALYILKVATPLDTFLFIRTLLARNFFLLLFPTLFYSVRHRLSVLEAMRRESSELVNAFDLLSSGVLAIDHKRQILFVNQFLRNRHGNVSQGQTCATYLRCHGSSCGWCTQLGGVEESLSAHSSRERIYHAQNGQSYHATVASFPLQDKGEIVGAVAIITDISKHTQHEQQLAHNLAQSQGRERDLTQERAKWLQTYNDLGKRLVGYADLAELLQFVVDEVKSKMGVEVASLFLFDKQEEFLVRKSTAGIEPSWQPDEKYRVGDGLVGNTLVPVGDQKYGRPLHMIEADKDPHINLEYLHKYQDKLQSHQLKHLITVPLNGQNKSFGVLRVINKLEANGNLSLAGFTQKDVDFLVTIASMVAIAVENTSLLNETKRSLSDIKAVHDASQAVASSPNTQEMLLKIVDIAGHVSNSDHTGIVLVGEDGRLTMSVEDHLMQPLLHERARPTGVTKRVIDSMQPIFIDDTEKNRADHNPVVLARGFRSYAGIPIMARHKILGVLFVHSKQMNAFAQQADILEIFCNHVATALENTKLYRRVSDAARQEARRLLSEDLHDTMNFLHATLVMGISYQQELIENHEYEEAAANLSKSSKAALHTYRTLQRLLTDVRDPILQHDGMIPALEHYVEMLPTVAVDFVVNGHEPLTNDIEYAIYRVAQEAISNACKHSGREDVQVTVTLDKQPASFHLEISDNGHGFDAALTQLRRDAFGIQAMERWARSINAEFSMASQPGQGTRVCVFGTWSVHKEAQHGSEN